MNPRRFASVWVLAAWVLAVASVAAPGRARAADQGLQKGDFVAICGDSITEQKQYSVFIEDYLLMCKPQPDLRAMQFGWGGEVSWGFLAKMPEEALKFPATVVTTCYGMNDGGYSPITEAKGLKYKEAMTGIVKQYKAHGARLIVVGSPGVVDADTFKRPDPNDPEKDPRKKKRIPGAAMYNPTLAALRDIARDVARENDCAFANVHDAMMDAMTKAKAKYGPQYHVGGGDGVHPAANGQLCMAYAFLKGMGIDGNIGTITVDLAGNKAEATDGHKVLSVNGGAVEVESVKYPFCFYGDPKDPSATSGIIEFLPFNQDLNRYTLVVKGVQGKARVTWGKDTKEFAAADLEKGINLAAEFVLDNPFSEPFKAVQDLVRKQQNAETPLVKKTLDGIRLAKAAAAKPGAKPEDVAKAQAQIETLTKAAATETEQAKALFDQAAAAARQPVKHVIKVEVVK